ncbi:MAG TPA: HAMP domain-containing sensor histidine kinase [Fimbriiglobus sp.]
MLTLVALTAMGVLIDQYTQAELRRGRANEIKLVDKRFEEQRHDEIEKLDQVLFERAYALGIATRFNTGRQFGQSVFDFAPLAVPFGLAGVFQFATVEAIVQQRMYRLPNRIHDQVRLNYSTEQHIDQNFLKNIDDDEHFRDLYQVHPNQSQKPWRSKSLGETVLPLNKADFPNPLFGWKSYDLKLPDGTPVHGVILAFQAFSRTGPGPGPGRGGGGRGGGGRGGRNGRGGFRPDPIIPPPSSVPPAGPPEVMQRLYVQAARPLNTLDKTFATFESERADQINRINRDSDRTVLLLRISIIGIISAAIVALLIGSLLLTRRGLKPLDRLSLAVSHVSEKDFQLPVRADELSTELTPIHTRITETLGALKRAFEREKQAVADISHELRTPIAALGITMEVALKKTRTPEQYKQTLTECRDINSQLGKLVERIMTLATLDAGTGQTAAVEVDAADIAASCVTIVKPLAEAHGMTFSTAIARPLPVTTDADKLREVLMNLLHNAVEYNRPGGVIELSATRDGHHGITFGVRDTGIGMTPEVQEKVFERFYRADPSRTATGIHAGLGLAIVKEYVDRLGGTIAVESAPNVGSTFRLHIPETPNRAS